MKALKLIALFLISLIVSLPAAYAGIQVRAYGIEEAFNDQTGLGYIAESDRTTFNATIDQTGVQSTQVTVEGETFDSCKDVGSNSECLKQFEYISTTPNAYPYTVRFGAQSRQGTVIVDDSAPEIILSDIQQNGGGDVTASFSIQERSYEDSSCSGLESLEFTIDGVSVHTVNLGFAVGTNCDYPVSGLETEDFTIPGTTSDDREICLIAIDKVGNVGESCDTFFIDNSVTQLTNLEILDGQEVLGFLNIVVQKP